MQIKQSIYQDATQSIENRVNDLLSQMTIEEKVGTPLWINCRWVNYRIAKKTSYMNLASA